MKVLITGGAGFIGHHVVEHILKNTDWTVAIIDKLNYASTFDRLRDVAAYDDQRVSIFTADFSKSIPPGIIKEIGGIDYILHFGAETHVDRSIADPEPFVMSNVVGTMRLLDYACKVRPKWFVYQSTDEVFGPAESGVYYKEWDRYDSRNPYSATKAGGEELALAYANTYRLPVMITHMMNIFGERQHPEKFIPMCVRNILKGKKVLIHSDRMKVNSGSRHWLHARNAAAAVLFLLENGVKRDKYNVVGEEFDNLQIAQRIAELSGKPLKYEMVDFHSSRPGHDLRYSLDGSKLRNMGFKYPVSFDDSFDKTIKWMFNNPKWHGSEN